jgi:hypothetical protein
MGWMAGGEMFVGIPIDQEGSGLVGPWLVAEAVEIVTEIPCVEGANASESKPTT